MKWKNLLNGLTKKNPALILILGAIPLLALSAVTKDALWMGAVTLVVLVIFNVAAALLKKIIPDTIRMPAHLVIAAGLVTVAGLVLKAYEPQAYQALGIYLPLVAVNCLVLGGGSVSAGNSVIKGVRTGALNGVGTGLVFIAAIFVLGSIREILGSGAWFALDFTARGFHPMSFLATPAGGFFVFGVLFALVSFLTRSAPNNDFERGGCGLEGNEEEQTV